jgi:hypothetical protein
MRSDSLLIPVYVIYSTVSIGLVVLLARTLFKNGAVFLEDVFKDNAHMADSVNRLLVIGFYMLNLGYAALLLQADAAPDAVTATEVLVHKLGLLLLSLGFLHFVNLGVFASIRRRSGSVVLPPPVAPQAQYTADGHVVTWQPVQ